MELAETTYVLLALVGFIAGFIDSIAGGGGLLALPSLLLAGLDPVTALATNKLQGTFGTASATWTFWRKGLLRPQDHIFSILMVFVGAVFGVVLLSYAPRGFLSLIMPVMLLGVAIYFALAPRLSDTARTARLPVMAFTLGFAPLLGFYDGVFGPGTGSFFMLALVTLFGLGVLEATARTKLFNFTSNIAALLMFLVTAKFAWSIGLIMGIAQLAGAQVGSRLAIRKGADIIRPMLVSVCLAMAAKLLWDGYLAYAQ